MDPPDDTTPSIFEPLSAWQLSSLIPPSLRYILAVLTHRHPRCLLRILNNFDELYLILSLAIETHFLRTENSTFVENFYGLQREKLPSVFPIPRAGAAQTSDLPRALRLRKRDIQLSLLAEVFAPYLKRKLDESWEIHASPSARLVRTDEEYPSEGTGKQKFLWVYKLFLRRLYPSVNMAWFASKLVFQMSYLFGGRYASPGLWIAGLRLRRGVAEAPPAVETLGKGKGFTPGEGRSLLTPRVMAGAVAGGLKVLLPTAIFLLKFLEWWHASDFARVLSKKVNEGLELPPPVGRVEGGGKRDDVGRGNGAEKGDDAGKEVRNLEGVRILTVAVVEGGGSCPICLGVITAPTAAQSGHVYCYKCIYMWVEGNHPRQEMGEEGWGDEKWDSGKGRDAVTGRRVLGGTRGLRRVIV
ncbi:hypothetical protein K470DRAFT_219514 [Piedraia hortae CBS 480.64]|uniref:Peroxisome assembly protein 12 n=1 Tax=Piedraia hortae CBS 480.64 TaxID=1314780 RepID=A0A6A7BXQ3_9PEZI|nr:hypothetical protein K470DRAFT_219514 [Piedraia hortae CBS 480.64]